MPPKTILNGLVRFHKYLQTLQTDILMAATKKNPALYLYHRGTRTSLFMLEALCRMYKNIYYPNKFNKLLKQFKVLEDVLGAIDYYDNIYKQVQTNTNVPSNIKGFLRTKTIEKQQLLNSLLLEKKWIGKHNKRLNKIAQKLEKIKWMDGDVDKASVEKTYIAMGVKIALKIKDKKINFDTIEEDVHELRRELRWLSIYPQCFDGLFAFAPEPKTKPAYIQKYLTDDVLKSPFNVLPVNKNVEDKILLNKNNFLALSWLIATLGKLKDEGLLVLALKEAVQNVQHTSPQEAEKIAYTYCGKEQMNLAQILQKAKAISQVFFKEKIVENLV